ncbi:MULTISPECIES: PfkB family carbohydrate kinase [unclassified Streptomyces]|uniref:carbohydrate kinase family protein n=1 Tax=unclassified Streptomyces TaxID=2593676 RepID=UPI002E363C47|nr:PfkB family carbohydrate kinase [Streptomyces sp. NBC_01431]
MPSLSPHRADILVVGGINMDLLLWADRLPDDDDSVWTSRPAERRHGGHAANCAHALAVTGCRVALVGTVGRDAEGTALIAALAERGVDVTPVRRTEEALTGHVVVSSLGGRRFMVMDRGANALLAPEDVTRALRRIRPSVVVVFDPPPATAVAALTARPPGTVTIAAPGGTLIRDPAVLRALDGVDWLVTNAPERRSMDALVDEGAQLPSTPHLVTTLGAAGVRLCRGRRSVALPAPRVEQAVDALGAGDAFVAGLAQAVAAGTAPEEAAHRGQLLAARVLKVPGARLPHPPAPSAGRPVEGP